MGKRIAMILLFGFEEIEAVVPADVLRRLGFDLSLAGEGDLAEGSHGVRIKTDCRLDDLDADKLDCIILPGGMPGSVNLMKNAKVLKLVRDMDAAGKMVAAICAAPIALAAAGVIKGLKITAHPSVKDQLRDAAYTGAMTEHDRNIVTGKGPGASFEFACRVAFALGKGDKSERLMGEMFVK